MSQEETRENEPTKKLPPNEARRNNLAKARQAKLDKLKKAKESKQKEEQTVVQEEAEESYTYSYSSSDSEELIIQPKKKKKAKEKAHKEQQQQQPSYDQSIQRELNELKLMVAGMQQQKPRKTKGRKNKTVVQIVNPPKEAEKEAPKKKAEPDFSYFKF